MSHDKTRLTPYESLTLRQMVTAMYASEAHCKTMVLGISKFLKVLADERDIDLTKFAMHEDLDRFVLIPEPAGDKQAPVPAAEQVAGAPPVQPVPLSGPVLVPDSVQTSHKFADDNVRTDTHQSVVPGS